MNPKALYIHIPFCEHICSYCDFCKVYYQEDIVDLYLKRLAKDLSSLEVSTLFDTIYIGGGTPSALNECQLSYLMKLITPFVHPDIKEVTIECNPENININKLKILKDGGITRLSIGVQSFQDEILQAIDRHHSGFQAIQVIQMAQAMGFFNISIDLMYGIKNQTIELIKKDLDVVASLDIQHLSYYSLILEEHTKLMLEDPTIMDESLEEEIDELLAISLQKMGFNRYEISNYAKEGYQSLHNLTYWHYQDYYGVGLGASGKLGNTLYSNNRNLNKYLKGESIVEKSVLTREEDIFQCVMMSLRLVEGIDLSLLKKRFHYDMMKEKKEVIEKYIKLSLLEIKDGYLRCSNDGLKYLNAILVDFME